jgi:hypothetical protein
MVSEGVLLSIIGDLDHFVATHEIQNGKGSACTSSSSLDNGWLKKINRL